MSNSNRSYAVLWAIVTVSAEVIGPLSDPHFLVFATAACTRTVTPSVPDVPQPPPAISPEPLPCVTIEPPASPRDHSLCVDMTDDECAAMKRATWSDYGHEAARWIELYAWPSCGPKK
jgi:hypothetical protein